MPPGYLEVYLYLSEFPVCLPLPENQLGMWSVIQFGAWSVVSHTVWSSRVCCVRNSVRIAFRLMMVGSPPGPPTLLGSADNTGNPVGSPARGHYLSPYPRLRSAHSRR